MRVIIAGGGTGGHLFPGLAVAREIQRRHAESDVLFVGSEQGIENRVVPREGFALKTLPVGGIKGMSLTRRIRNLAAMAGALVVAIGIVRSFRPDVVIGVGGYASFPVVAAAILSGLPCMVMEQNVVPGLANRVLGRWVRVAAVSDERSTHYFGRRAVVTGNPVRSEFKSIAPKTHAAPFTVLVFGGSQGARAINRAVIEALPHLTAWRDRLRFVHQTGRQQVEEVRRAYVQAGFAADVAEFFDRFHRQYEAADLIVSRAGATTVAEIKASGRASVLIPFPFAADDHQTRNAQAMVEEGAAVLIPPTELGGQKLAGAMEDLLSAPKQLESMEANARRIARPDAESRIVDLVERLMPSPAGRGRRESGG